LHADYIKADLARLTAEVGAIEQLHADLATLKNSLMLALLAPKLGPLLVTQFPPFAEEFRVKQ
jgi:hypothetical protein